MTRGGKRLLLVVGVLLLAALGSSVWISIWHSESEVQRVIAAVQKPRSRWQ